MSNQTSVFSFNVASNGVGTLTIDVPGDSQNTLKKEFVVEFEQWFSQVKKDQTIKAIVIISGKENSFIAGADISMLKDVQAASEAESLANEGQRCFQQLEDLPIPVVAAIHGPCLGGGLELAMACHQRVATDDSSTKLGLPEVQLGVLPGGGGTQRLPRLVGLTQALDLILTGKQLNAFRAKKAGLIDEVVPLANLVKAVEKRALALSSKRKWRKSSQLRGVGLKGFLSVKGLQTLLLERNRFGRNIVFNQAKKTLQSKTRGNYPAPESIIECIEVGLNSGFALGIETEARLFGELVVSKEADSLMHLFFAVTDLKKDTGVEVQEEDVEARRPIQHVGVLGGGLMGAGIAYVTIDKAAKQVRIKDVDVNGVNHALNYSWKNLNIKLKRRQLSKVEAGKVFSRLTGTTDYLGFKNSDLVIEAVFESLELKHQMLRDIEKHCKDETIFATNTSSIPITEIAKVSERPENVIGLHYFSPVEKMPLLEIIKTRYTAPSVIARCVEFGKAQGKTVIVVDDGAGFYVNRILAPYMNEAGHLIAEGVPVDRVDSVLMDAGFPVGPMMLLDEVGIDVATKVAPILKDAFGERMQPPSMFSKLNSDDRKGKKNRKGFYQYDQKGKSLKLVDESVYKTLDVRPELIMDAAQITERCLLLMVNEAVRCLEDGILRNARDGDIGAIFGIGFPPFLGGPFRFVDTKTPLWIVERLNIYQERLGERFKPCELLVTMSESKQLFHS